MATSLVSRGSLGLGGAIVAGAISAALFAVAVEHAETLLIMIAYLAAMPLFVAGLGAGAISGLLASLFGTAGLFLAHQSSAAFAYIIINALPAAILMAMALRHNTSADQKTGWCPEGYLLTAITLYPCLLFALTLGFTMNEDGGLLGLTTKMVTEAANQVKIQFDDPAKAQRFMAIVDKLVRVLPALVGWAWMFVTMISIGAAQYILQQQKWNLRPGFFLNELRIPQWLIMATAATGLVGSLAPAPYDYIGLNLCIILCVPFLFVGLAVIHVYAATTRARMAILVVFYILLSFIPWLALLVTILGAADQWANFRQRFAAKATR